MIHRWLVIMSLSIFLLTGLSTSSFFLADFLTRTIKKNEHTAKQLNFAIAQKNDVALLYAMQSSKEGTQTWQKLAKELGKRNGQVAYFLGDFYLTKYNANKEFSSYLDKAKLWYKQAIRLNYYKASVALAELNFKEGKILIAQSLLEHFQLRKSIPSQHNDVTISAIILTIKMAISIGNLELANLITNKFYSLLNSNEVGISLLNLIEKYQILTSINERDNKRGRNTLICPNSIQFFATNLIHLTQLDHILVELKKKLLSDFVCFTPIRYLPISSLACSSEQQTAIKCNEAKFQGIADSINTRYIAIMLPKGGANVHLGILYFDAQDSVDVVEHEISHLLGFVDEYPLVKEHIRCRTPQQQVFSQNIAVLKNSYEGERSIIRDNILQQLSWAEQIKKSTPILHSRDKNLKNNKYWQLGTPKEFEQQVGLFKAKTCDNNTAKQQNIFNAFKPLSEQTKLEYDELSFPKQYAILLQKNNKKFLMPSFHYNIALAYYQQNNILQARDWLEKSANLESDERRRKKVRLGDF